MRATARATASSFESSPSPTVESRSTKVESPRATSSCPSRGSAAAPAARAGSGQPREGVPSAGFELVDRGCRHDPGLLAILTALASTADADANGRGDVRARGEARPRSLQPGRVGRPGLRGTRRLGPLRPAARGDLRPALLPAARGRARGRLLVRRPPDRAEADGRAATRATCRSQPVRADCATMAVRRPSDYVAPPPPSLLDAGHARLPRGSAIVRGGSLRVVFSEPIGPERDPEALARLVKTTFETLKRTDASPPSDLRHPAQIGRAG